MLFLACSADGRARLKGGSPGAQVLALIVLAFTLACAGLSTPLRAATPQGAAAPNIALYYGADIPWDELAAFDIAVVEPDHAGVLKSRAAGPTQYFAYVSLGEIHPSRAYAKEFPAAWKLGENTAWGSMVVDQSASEWPEWIISHAFAPLWAAGYRGFFLDTLDSFNLVAKDAAQRQAQQEGLERVITEVARRFPGVKLIFNRGFEILPKVHDKAYAVAAESLYRGWDAGAKQYREVPLADRDWLLGQLNRVKDEYKLPVLAIDYVAPGERDLARTTARRIEALGFIPWVTNPAIDLLGVGSIEVMPRKVLMLYDADQGVQPLIYEDIQRYAAMPVNYLGYSAVYQEASAKFPAHPLAGRYAGIVAMFSSDAVGREADLSAFLKRAIAEGVKIAFLGSFGLTSDSDLGTTLGLRLGPAQPAAMVSIESRDPLVGFEVPVNPDRREFRPLQAMGGIPLLRLKNERGERMDAVALTPWGGYASRSYSLLNLPADRGLRWVIEPIEFLRRALALTGMPVPDTTTENGRRLMMVHIDGDGFANRAELPGSPFAGEVMVRDLLTRYSVPTTFSIIQGEVAANGLYPKLTPALESIAKKIFALPNVEAASHTFSHPFRWRKAAARDAAESGYSLAIPGYQFDVATEVNGSIDYINRTLMSDGKRAKILLWSGDCDPGLDSMEQADEAGLLNMNGGDTTITRAQPSLTLVSPLGIPKGKYFQVYAPNQNENVYTNLWTGPFYGYERAIETFELTDSPRRLKPIDVYYHSFAATKRASLTALQKVYAWALAQNVMNIYASEYIRKVLDFRRLVVARSATGWRIRGNGELRTLRLPAGAQVPDLARSTAVAGMARHNDALYLHLAAGEAEVVLGASAPTAPYLIDANGRIDALQLAARSLSFSIDAHTPIVFTLANARGCATSADGQRLVPQAAADGATRFQLTRHGTAKITIRCD